MSLLGALQVGKSSLAAQQAGLQVTGNNIANAGTEGYTRQVARLTPAGVEQLKPGTYLGTGVNVASVERQVNEALEESLRQATSGQFGASTLDTMVGRLESTFNALNDGDLASRLDAFFNNFSTLANNPQDAGQRSVVIQGGVSLVSYIQQLRSQVSVIRTDAEAQINALASQANTLTQTIAELNGRIQTAEAGGGDAGAIRDQRDMALTQLSQLIDIRVVPQGNGGINVLVGSVPLIQGNTSRGIVARQGVDVSGQFATTTLGFADSGDDLPVSSGRIGALMTARDSYITPAITTIDTIAGALISTVNAVHAQGQGLSGFSGVTGTTQVTSATAALNTAGIGLPGVPVNGTFNLHIKDASTGQTTTRQITVNLSGNGAQTTLASLAAGINAAAGGAVSATVSPTGQLSLAATGNNVSFTFSDDTSNVLSVLGVNTFFTGKDAATIGINTALLAKPDLLATGRDNIAGSNRNAQAIALAGGAASGILGGMSIKDFYTTYVGNLASQARNAGDDATAQQAIRDTLYAQREAVSGVSLDEEAINLTKFQRAFQGTARYITVIDEMMQVVLGMVR